MENDNNNGMNAIDYPNEPPALQVETAPLPKKKGRPKGSKQKPRKFKPDPSRPVIIEHEGKRVHTVPVPPDDATPQEIVKYLAAQDKVMWLMHASLTKYREMFRILKLQKQITPSAVTAMAAIGHTKRQVARSLRFSESTWNQRPDIVEAYEEGRAALESALLAKEVEMALCGSEKLLVHLGINLLGQSTTPTTAIQINNTGVGTTAMTIKEKMAEARKKAIAEFNDTKNVIDAEIVEPETGE
jgi:hypothetical protein